MMETQTIRITITSTPWPLDIAITPTEISADPPELRLNKTHRDLKSMWMKRDAFGVIK